MLFIQHFTIPGRQPPLPFALTLSPDRDRVEQELRHALESSRNRCSRNECSEDEYLDALRRFADFILHGTVPEKRFDIGRARPILEEIRKKKPD